MAGFLDSKEQVLDVVLTGRGKALLAQGALQLVYWIPFDDEVDYDPWIQGASELSASDLAVSKSLKTEEPLIREACTGYAAPNRACWDRVNLNRPLFSIPPGQPQLPEVTLPTGVLQVESLQRKISTVHVQKDQKGNVIEQVGPLDSGVERFNPSRAGVRLTYGPGSYSGEFPLEGFLVTAYQSGTEGYSEVLHARNSQGDLVYNNDLMVEIEQ